MERFHVRKPNELEVRKQYQITTSKSCAALDNLSYNEDVNRTWENITENIKTLAKESPGLHELKQHKLRPKEANQNAVGMGYKTKAM